MSNNLVKLQSFYTKFYSRRKKNPPAVNLSQSKNSAVMININLGKECNRMEKVGQNMWN